MTLDLDELERKAKEGTDRGLPYYDWLSGRLHPRIVLALIERVRAAETALRTIRDDGLSRDDARDEARKALNINA